MSFFTSKRFLLPFFFSLSLVVNIFLSRDAYSTRGTKVILWSDPFWYYEYLPALFNRNDIEHIRGAYQLPNGKTFNKYSYGTALHIAPFFLVTELILKIAGVPSGGVDDIHGLMVLIAGSVYFFIGLAFVFFLLQKWFSSIVAWTSVIIIYFGTNAFHYVIWEPGMSHVYAFFCCAGFLFFTERLFSQGEKFRDFMFVALFLSLTIIIRPTNVLLALLLLFFNVYTLKEFKDRITFFISRWKWLLAGFALAFLLAFPQLYYWHITAGKWLLDPYSYSNESFLYLSSPKIFERMFGVQCGWIPYSPLMVFSLIGLIVLIIKKKFNGLAILSVFLPIVYLCSSWWCNFSCAYGFRPYVDFYPLLIIPVAFLLSGVIATKKKYLIALSYSGILFGIYFTVGMAYLFMNWPFCDPSWNWEGYWKAAGTLFSWL